MSADNSEKKRTKQHSGSSQGYASFHSISSSKEKALAYSEKVL
jgi:hypothetical protein